MADLDPAAADGIRILLSAGVGAIAGGLVAEWRGRAAENRAVAREQDAEQRADAREAKALRRDHMLRQISDTRADLQGALSWHLLRSMGATDKLGTVRYGQEHFPDANVYLVGDEGLLQQYIDFVEELRSRPPGGGLSELETAMMGALTGHISARLDAQRDRVMRGLPPIWPSNAFVQAQIDRLGEQYSIPVEYRPKVNPNAVDPPL